MTKHSSAHPETPLDNSAHLRGFSRLTVDAVVGVTSLVEKLHGNIANGSPVVGQPTQESTKGIAGLVYHSVRGISRAVGLGLDLALAQLAPRLGPANGSPQRAATLAALNGVMGDYLDASANPLAISMRLRSGGKPLILEADALHASIAQPGGKLLLLLHGLCMNDQQWERDGHDHGAALARDLGYTPLYLHYNSGRHISYTGSEFSDLMEQLLMQWPAPVTELVIVGHSMGGLVARSACHHAKLAGHGWLHHLNKLVFLGAPHHGAPLERAGHWVDALISISPYTAPFGALGKLRSDGIKDLRFGNLLDEDWEWHSGESHHDHRSHVPLPAGVRCYAIAATKQAQAMGHGQHLPGDGLVPVDSALGRSKKAAMTLAIPESRQWVGYGMGHFDLLSRADVYDQLRRWLAEE